MFNTIESLHREAVIESGRNCELLAWRMDQPKQAYFPFIPHHGSLPDVLLSGKRFIDIGCGIGQIVLTVAKLAPNMECIGLEVQPDLVKKAKKHQRDLQITNANFVVGDAFDYDFSGFDRLYSYMPIQDRSLMRKLWRKVWREMAPGAMWYEVYWHCFNDDTGRTRDIVPKEHFFTTEDSRFKLVTK